MLEYVQIGFSEDWYNDRFDADFTEDFWIDPVKRTESYRDFDYQVCSYSVNAELFERKLVERTGQVWH